MFAFIVFIFAIYGMANAVAVLKFGTPIRKAFGNIPVIRDLVKCPPCMAFWLGMLVSAFVLSPAAQIVTPGWRSILLDGLSASGLIWLIHVAAERTSYGLDNI